MTSSVLFLLDTQVYNTTIVTMAEATTEYYYTDDNNQVVGPHTYAQLMHLRQQGELFDDTMVCEKGASKWVAFGDVMISQSKEKAKAAKEKTPKHANENINTDVNMPDISAILEEADLPLTCRLIRVVCRIVICFHTVGFFAGIGAGIGCLFKHANPGLGAAIGALVGMIVFIPILNKIESNEEDEQE